VSAAGRIIAAMVADSSERRCRGEARKLLTVDAARLSGGSAAGLRGGVMKALVSWDDENGTRHSWVLAYDPDDAEARSFLEGIELHVRFRLESFDVDAGAARPEN
jgi:hypothetical protein